LPQSNGALIAKPVLAKDKAGVPARDKNAMAGERAAERKTNIRELGYSSTMTKWAASDFGWQRRRRKW
jgi:hypothetical protein